MWGGFIIVLPAEDVVQVFGDNLKISLIAAVTQAHQQMCLILNMLENPNEGTLSVNKTTDREVAP